MSSTTDVAIMNSIVKEEIRKHQAKRRAETERARTVEASRDRLLARRLSEIEKVINPSPNLLRRLWRPVANAWAMFWAVALNGGEIFLAWCEKRKLIEKVEE